MEVVRHIFADVIKNNEVFRGGDNELIEYVLSHIHTSAYPPEDEIITQDDSASAMYLLSLGECEVLVKDHKK